MPRFLTAPISIHAAHMGSDDVEPKKEDDHDVSIHAARTGSDRSTPFEISRRTHFYSRYPYGQRLAAGLWGCPFLFTPPTWAATTPTTIPTLTICYFYSRHLHGWRLMESVRLFLFTPPVWAATGDYARLCVISIHATHAGSDDSTVVKHLRLCISIHATRTGGDGKRSKTAGGHFYFYSRRPYGQRQKALDTPQEVIEISIHATRVGSDSL